MSENPGKKYILRYNDRFYFADKLPPASSLQEAIERMTERIEKDIRQIARQQAHINAIKRLCNVK